MLAPDPGMLGSRSLLLLLPLALLAACTPDPSDAQTAAFSPEKNAASPPDVLTPTPAEPPIPASDDVFADVPLGTTKPSLREVVHPVAPGAVLSKMRAPLPTHAFWENLALGTGQNRINVLPYQLRGLANGLAVSLPNVVTSATGALTPLVTDITLGATADFARREIVARDDLSATVAFVAQGAGTMTAPIVEGMAYVTARYDGVTPLLSTDHAILSIDGKSPGGSVSGTRFEVKMNDGKTWIVYASQPITFASSMKSLAATAPFTGDVRVAIASSPETVAALDQSRATIPLGGVTRARIEGASAIFEMEWRTSDDTSPLMFTLPHHQARLDDAPTGPARVRTIRGEMIAVARKKWTLRYASSELGFAAPRPIDPARRDALVAALAADASFVPDPVVVSQDPYFGGKQLAKLARLILVAEELGDAARADAMRARLAPLVSAWLDGTNGNPLVYDDAWGGIVTSRGVGDPGADFGQGYYNDHHFHYGYHLYAAAVLAKGDPAWGARYRDKVLWLVRDIANPASSDPFFPRLRHIDFFAGHSWANGLFDLGDGRNQESTSEAANAWYAVSLVGRAFESPRLTDLGRALFAAEVASAQTYWQIPASSKVYDGALASRRVVANLWSTKADYGTFFGDRPEYVFGIQMLPYTPATEQLLPASWIADAWPLIAPAASAATPAWGGLLYMAHAVVDKNAAWSEVERLSAWDDGNSRTNALYWVATRP